MTEIVHLPKIPAPFIGWRYAQESKCLQEWDVSHIQKRLKEMEVSPSFHRVEYLSESLMRPMGLIEGEEQDWYVDTDTGQLYDPETMLCQSSSLMKLVIEVTA